MDNPKIGKKDASGAVIQWPLVDITGASYTRPCTTLALDGTHFVVTPVNFVDYAGEVAALRVSLMRTRKDVTRRGEKPETSDSGE